MNMRIRSPKDFWAGLFFVAVALGFIGLARPYGMGNMHRMGPALFPTLIGALLVGLGLVIALRGFAVDGPPLPRFHGRPIIISLIAIALFGVALAHAGLVAAIAVLVIVGAVASRESKPRETIGLALVLIAFSVAVFVWLLGLPIPIWPEP
jgi:putative tricarboxylic transport membrane protein